MPESAKEPFDRIACSNVNAVWGALTMEVLARLGVQTVITSPGSRSTPLTIAAVRNPDIEALSILDERSAGFYALGLARRTHYPVALVATSGSAVANYFPATVEASESGVPLLLLTADRPPELRDCGSGQTIDQLKLYGGYVRSFRELALPEVNREMLLYLRQSLVHAIHQSLGPDPGPVHLNFPFRDPLLPELEKGGPVVAQEWVQALATVEACPGMELKRSGRKVDLLTLEQLSRHQKGLIVVGTFNPVESEAAFAEAVATISDKLGWPVLADVLNPLRHYDKGAGTLVAGYDTFLREEATAELLKPEVILQIGSLPTSPVLRRWLGSPDAVSFLCTSRPMNADPLHRRARPIDTDPVALSEQLEAREADPNWRLLWARLDRKTLHSLSASLDKMNALFEGKVAWLLSQYLPVSTSVFLANSMSVRYAEYFWLPGNRGYSVAGNRGANGIDGTLSTALGMAHRGNPAVLLTGDLAFLHDSNGLSAGNQLKGSLTVVLVNNNGGGIFEHLPVASMDPPFEAYFATPQSPDIGTLCKSYGVEHHKIMDWADFLRRLSKLPDSGISVLEIQTDRKADCRTLRQIQSQASSSAAVKSGFSKA